MGLSWLRQRDLVLVLVLVMLTSSSSLAIELTGGNICPRMENYTVTLKESYVEPVVVNTFAWCLQIPPRCLKSRIETRERWRIKTETRQRELMDCCEGYVVKIAEDAAAAGAGAASTGKCVPRCDFCEYGRCVAPNTCVCTAGHEGEGCVNECRDGTWGEMCSQICSCQTDEICNPVDGKCHCPPGWQGSSCKEKCRQGYWGIDCGSICSCMSSENVKFKACHHETGMCTNTEEMIIEIPVKVFNATTVLVAATKSILVEPDERRSTSIIYYDSSDGDSKSEVDDDQLNWRDRLANKPQQFATRSPKTTESEINELNETDNHERASATESGLSEISMEPGVFKIGTTARPPIAANENNYGNYDGRLDTRLPKGKKPSTPIVAVVHVSGNAGTSGHDGPMIMTSMNAGKVATHVVPMPLDVVALIVVGSIISLGLTTLAVLAVLYIRSRIFETIRLSIYDGEKRESTNGTISRVGGDKGNSTRISSMGCNSSIIACEYETPRCIVPEHQTLPRPRPASSLDIIKKQESNYSNDIINEYPNIRLFSNLQELLEAHYDRPPSTFRPAVFDIDGEHVYDEIPLQSSTTFTSKRDL